MLELLWNVLASGIGTAAAILVVAKVKHHFEPLTAVETLRRENFLNSQRDVYFEAAAILCRHLEHAEWNGPDVPSDRQIPTGQKPTEAEINGCSAKLVLYSDDPEIPREFINACGICSVASLFEFLSRLRKDLGYKELNIHPNEYLYLWLSSQPVGEKESS